MTSQLAQGELPGGGLACEDVLPLRWQTVPGRPEEGVLLRVNEGNEVLMRFLVTLDDHQNRLAEDLSDVALELSRIESKVNLLLELVSQVLRQEIGMPEPRPVRFSGGGLRWPETDETPAPGQMLELALYLYPAYPRPLQLFGEVTAVERGDEEDGAWVTVGFVGLSASVRDVLEKIVFRRHRRSVAQRRQDRDEG